MLRIFKYGQYVLVCICILTFFYILKDFRSENLKNIISGINYSYILSSIVVAAFVVLVKVFRLKIISEQFGLKINFKLAYKTQTISIILALLTPGRIGEVSKIFLLSENKKEKFPIVTNITLFEISIDFLCISFISLLFVFLILKNYFLSVIILMLILIFITVAVLISKGKFLNNISGSLKTFFNYIKAENIYLSYKWYFTLPLTAIAWFFDGVFQYFILKAVDIPSYILLLVALSAISSVISILSVLPLGLGVSDLSSLYFYNSFLKLNKEQVVYLTNSTRLFLIMTLLLLSIPFIQLLFKRDWYKSVT